MLKGIAVRIVVRTMMRVAMAVAESRRVAGFDVFYGPDQADTDAAIAKIQGALAVIAEHDPRRFRRMRRDMDRLMMVGKGLRVYPDLRLGTLEGPWLVRHSVQEIAVSLIEMGARARIGRIADLRSVDEGSRERIWRRAALEQLAFLSRLPDRTDAMQRMEAAIRTRLGTDAR